MRDDDNPFETSIDSGICLDTSPGEENKVKTYQHILFVLERDQRLRAEQRKRLSQLSDKRLRKKRNEEPCNVCCVNLDAENIKICVKCINCQKIACRGQDCSTWIPSRSGWECQLCNHSNESCSKSSEWLHQQITGRFLSPLSARAEPNLLRDSYPILEFDGRSETASSFGGDQKERVRQLVEETLGDMLGGSLNNVSIGQLYKSRDYLPTWENGDCPGVSHVKLKRLIEKIVQETLRLPSVTDQPNNPGSSGDENLPFFDPKKYQELLATAVLNKIVDSYNYEKKFEGNREAASTRLDLDKNHNALIRRKEQSGSVSSSSIEPESDWSITDPPTNISRCDDFSRSDSGSNLFSDILNRNDQRDSSILNDYIAKHKVPLPDFSIASDSSNEDIQDSVTSACTENTWDRNWLFKKKRSGQDGSGPVGMLVPCPKEDIKTQIGDRTADELSDLSEAGSDFDEEDQEMAGENPPNVRIQNRCVIGGKSPVGLFDELLEQTSLISSSSLADGDAVFTETKNDFVLGDDLHNDVGQSSAFDAGEAVNSLVDTKNLRENLSNSKQVQDDSLISESGQPDDLSIERPPVAKPRSKKKVTQTIFISTKDIPEAELTTSSAGSSVHNSGNVCEELSSSPTQTTNPTNNNNIEEQLPQLPYTTQPSAIQFLAVSSLAPSLAVTAVDADNIDDIIRISHAAQPKAESLTGFDISDNTELCPAVDIGTPEPIQVDVLTESKSKIPERSEQPQSPLDLKELLEVSPPVKLLPTNTLDNTTVLNEEVTKESQFKVCLESQSAALQIADFQQQTQSSSAVRSEQNPPNSEQSDNSKIELDFDGLIPPPMEFGTESFDLEMQNPEVPASVKIEMHFKSELHVPVEEVQKLSRHSYPEANEESSPEKKEIKNNTVLYKSVEESVETGNEKTEFSEEFTPDSSTSTLSQYLESQLKKEPVPDYETTKLEEVQAIVESAFETELAVAAQDQPLNESQGFNPDELMNKLIPNESQGEISVNQVTEARSEEIEFSIDITNPKSQADLAIQEAVPKVIPEEFLERAVPETSECKIEGSEHGTHLNENEVEVTLKEDECKNNEPEQKTLISTYPDIENMCSSCEATIQTNEPTEELISSLSINQGIASTENNASSEIIESNDQNTENLFEEPTQQIAVESTNIDQEPEEVSEMLQINEIEIQEQELVGSLISSGTGVFCSQDEVAGDPALSNLGETAETLITEGYSNNVISNRKNEEVSVVSLSKEEGSDEKPSVLLTDVEHDDNPKQTEEHSSLETGKTVVEDTALSTVTDVSSLDAKVAITEAVNESISLNIVVADKDAGEKSTSSTQTEKIETNVKDSRDNHEDKIVEPALTLETEDMKLLAAKKVDGAKSSIEETPLKTKFMEVAAEVNDSNSTIEATATETVNMGAALGVNDSNATIKEISSETGNVGTAAEAKSLTSTSEAILSESKGMELIVGQEINDYNSITKDAPSGSKNTELLSAQEVNDSYATIEETTNMATKAEVKDLNSEATSTENKDTETLATQGVNDSNLTMATENMVASAEIKDSDSIIETTPLEKNDKKKELPVPEVEESTSVMKDAPSSEASNVLQKLHLNETNVPLAENSIEKDDKSKDHVSATVIESDEIIETTVLTLTKTRNDDQNQIEAIQSLNVSSNDPTIDEELPPDCMEFSSIEPSEQSIAYFQEKCLKSIEITLSSSEKIEENLEMSLLDDEKPPDCMDFTSFETPPPTYEEISTGSCAELQARHKSVTGHVEKKSKIPIKIKTEGAKEMQEENKKTIAGSSNKEETVHTATIKIPFSEDNVCDVFDIEAIAPPAEFQCPDIEDYEDQSFELTSANPTPIAETDCKHDSVQSKKNVSEPTEDIRLKKASVLCEETVSIDIQDTVTKSCEAGVNKMDSVSLESDENLKRLELQEGFNVEAQVEISEQLSKSELLEDDIQVSKDKDLTKIDESKTENLVAIEKEQIITKEVDASKNEESFNEAGNRNLTKIENRDQPPSELAESNTSEEIEASKPPESAEYTTNLEATNTQNTTSSEHSYNITQSSRHEQPIAETSMKRVTSEHEFIMEMESDLFHFAEAVCDDNFEDVEDDFEDFFMSQESIEIIDPRKMPDLSRTIITETVQRKPTGTVKKQKRGVLSKDEIIQQTCGISYKENELLNEASSDLTETKKPFITNEVSECEKITKMKRDHVDSSEIVEVVESTSMVRGDTGDSIKIEDTINLQSESKLEELNQFADAAIIITNQTDGSNKSTSYKEPFKNSKAQKISLNEDDVAQVTNEDQSTEESKVTPFEKIDYIHGEQCEEKAPLSDGLGDSLEKITHSLGSESIADKIEALPLTSEIQTKLLNKPGVEEKPDSSESRYSVKEEQCEEVDIPPTNLKNVLVNTSLYSDLISKSSTINVEELTQATIQSSVNTNEFSVEEAHQNSLHRINTVEEEFCEEECTSPNAEEVVLSADVQSNLLKKSEEEEEMATKEGELTLKTEPKSLLTPVEEKDPLVSPDTSNRVEQEFCEEPHPTTPNVEELTILAQNELQTEERPSSSELINAVNEELKDEEYKAPNKVEYFLKKISTSIEVPVDDVANKVEEYVATIELKSPRELNRSNTVEEKNCEEESTPPNPEELVITADIQSELFPEPVTEEKSSFSEVENFVNEAQCEEEYKPPAKEEIFLEKLASSLEMPNEDIIQNFEESAPIAEPQFVEQSSEVCTNTDAAKKESTPQKIEELVQTRNEIILQPVTEEDPGSCEMKILVQEEQCEEVCTLPTIFNSSLENVSSLQISNKCVENKTVELTPTTDLKSELEPGETVVYLADNISSKTIEEEDSLPLKIEKLDGTVEPCPSEEENSVKGGQCREISPPPTNTNFSEIIEESPTLTELKSGLDPCVNVIEEISDIPTGMKNAEHCEKEPISIKVEEIAHTDDIESKLEEKICFSLEQTSEQEQKYEELSELSITSEELDKLKEVLNSDEVEISEESLSFSQKEEQSKNDPNNSKHSEYPLEVPSEFIEGKVREYAEKAIVSEDDIPIASEIEDTIEKKCCVEKVLVPENSDQLLEIPSEDKQGEVETTEFKSEPSVPTVGEEEQTIPGKQCDEANSKNSSIEFQIGYSSGNAVETPLKTCELQTELPGEPDILPDSFEASEELPTQYITLEREISVEYPNEILQQSPESQREYRRESVTDEISTKMNKKNSQDFEMETSPAHISEDESSSITTESCHESTSTVDVEEPSSPFGTSPSVSPIVPHIQGAEISEVLKKINELAKTNAETELLSIASEKIEQSESPSEITVSLKHIENKDENISEQPKEKISSDDQKTITAEDLLQSERMEKASENQANDYYYYSVLKSPNKVLVSSVRTSEASSQVGSKDWPDVCIPKEASTIQHREKIVNPVTEVKEEDDLPEGAKKTDLSTIAEREYYYYSTVQNIELEKTSEASSQVGPKDFPEESPAKSSTIDYIEETENQTTILDDIRKENEVNVLSKAPEKTATSSTAENEYYYYSFKQINESAPPVITAEASYQDGPEVASTVQDIEETSKLSLFLDDVKEANEVAAEGNDLAEVPEKTNDSSIEGTDYYFYSTLPSQTLISPVIVPEVSSHVELNAEDTSSLQLIEETEKPVKVLDNEKKENTTVGNISAKIVCERNSEDSPNIEICAIQNEEAKEDIESFETNKSKIENFTRKSELINELSSEVSQLLSQNEKTLEEPAAGCSECECVEQSNNENIGPAVEIILEKSLSYEPLTMVLELCASNEEMPEICTQIFSSSEDISTYDTAPSSLTDILEIRTISPDLNKDHDVSLKNEEATAKSEGTKLIRDVEETSNESQDVEITSTQKTKVQHADDMQNGLNIPPPIEFQSSANEMPKELPKNELSQNLVLLNVTSAIGCSVIAPEKISTDNCDSATVVLAPNSEDKAEKMVETKENASDVENSMTVLVQPENEIQSSPGKSLPELEDRADNNYYYYYTIDNKKDEQQDSVDSDVKRCDKGVEDTRTVVVLLKECSTTVVVPSIDNVQELGSRNATTEHIEKGDDVDEASKAITDIHPSELIEQEENPLLIPTLESKLDTAAVFVEEIAPPKLRDTEFETAPPLEFELDSGKTSEIAGSSEATSVPSTLENTMDGNLTETEKVSEQKISDGDNETDMSSCSAINELAESILSKNLSKSEEIEESSNIVVEEIAKDNEPDTSNTTDTLFTNEELDMVAAKEDMTSLSTLESHGTSGNSSTESSEKSQGKDYENSCEKGCPIACISEASAISCQTVENSEIKRDFNEACNLEETNKVTNICIQIEDTPSKIEADSHEEQSKNSISDSPLVEACIIVAEDSHSDVDSSRKRVSHLKQLSYELADDYNQEKESTDMSFDADSLDRPQDDEISSLECQKNLMTDIPQDLAKSSIPVNENEDTVLKDHIFPVSETHHESIPKNPVRLENSQIVECGENDNCKEMKLCTKNVCTEGTASGINEGEGLTKVNDSTSTEDQDTKKIHNNKEQEQDDKPECYLRNASSPDFVSLRTTIEINSAESISKNEQPKETESDFENNQNEDPDDSDFVIKGHIMEEEYKDDECFIENFTEYSSPTISEQCEFTDSMDSASLNEEEEIEATSESQIKFYCEESLTKTNDGAEELAANKIVEYTEAIPIEIKNEAESTKHSKMVREFSIEYGVDASLMSDLTSFSDPTIEIPSESQQGKEEEQCAEYSPDSLECGEPELSVTPPELSLSYMTPTFLEAIPEDFELSESPPKLTFENIETLRSKTFRTNEDTSQTDSSSIESQDQYDEETIQGNYQEFPIDTTQQEEINTLSYSQTTTTSDIDLISPSVVFSLSADRTMSTESSTTSDDTVKTAIEKAGQLDIENRSVEILHKDLFPVPKETYSVTLSLQLIDNNLNNTNLEDFSMAQNSNATSTTTTSSTTLNGSSLKQQHSKFEILKSSAFSAQLSDEEDVVGHLSHLLPGKEVGANCDSGEEICSKCRRILIAGSIAEREHKKWYNAVDMPNNPYSKEALKRRLSGTSDKTFDIPNINTTLEKAVSEDTLQSGEETEISPEEIKVDYKRYGRDYYINDAKHASGMSRRSLTASSPFLSSIEDDKVSDKEISETPTPQPIPRSHSWGDKRCDTADIFAARPVRVEESDPILSKATKLEYLSTPDRDFYLLPTEEISSLRSISTSEHSLSQAGDSLTPSEDSDTIRVYDLKTQETRLLLRDDQVNSKSTIGTNTSGSLRQQEGLRSPLTSQRLAKSPVQNRTVTPSALKFLQPKRKLFNSRLIMSEDNTSSTVFDRENIVRSNGTPEKNVIEEDVVSSLPSVRALAKAFQNASKDSSAPVNRPKSSSWKSLDVKSNSEQLSSTPNIAEQSSPKTPSDDSYIPPYEQKYTPADSTETGTTVVEEKINGTCCVSDEKLNEHEANASELSEQEEVKPVSPQPLAVHFAENLETEQQPPSPEPVKTFEEAVPSPEPARAEESIPTPSTVEENLEEIPTPQIPQVTSAAIETPPDQEKCESNSLEWKEENIEIVDKDHLPTPQDDQPKEADPAGAVSVEPATPTPAERDATHSTPPNTPNPPEDEEEKEQVTLIAPTSCPVELHSVTPAEDDPTPEPATPLITPTSIQFEQNDEEISTPVQPVLETPPTSVQQPLENGDDKPTLNGSHAQNAPPAQDPEVSIAEPKSTESPIQTSLSQQQQPEQQSEPATSQNDVPKTSIVEEKRSEIRFTQESPTRERPISPVLVPGKLKSSIAFFENLKNNK